MLTRDYPLIQLLELIDVVWRGSERSDLKRGAPKYYSEQPMFKAYVVGLLKKL